MKERNRGIFSKAYGWSSSIYTHSFIDHHYLNDSLTDAPLSLHTFHISSFAPSSSLQLRCTCSWTRHACIMNFLCEGIVLWCLCLFVRAECANVNYKGADVSWKDPFAPVKFPFPAKEIIRIWDLDPRSKADCLSLYLVCSKRLPRKNNTVLSLSWNCTNKRTCFGIRILLASMTFRTLDEFFDMIPYSKAAESW